MNQLKEQLHAADAQNELPPPPLDLAAVKALLPDLSGLLNQAIPAAADAIRALTGPITIRQEKVAGKKRGAQWIATFSPDLLGWLRHTAKGTDCPESVTLEYLGTRIWITPEPVAVSIDHTPLSEQIAAEAEAMAVKGASVVTMARTLGHAEETGPAGPGLCADRPAADNDTTGQKDRATTWPVEVHRFGGRGRSPARSGTALFQRDRQAVEDLGGHRDAGL